MHASDRLAALRVLIGNTPLLEIDVELSGRKRTVWAKAENLNLTGSIKDRMAYHVLRSAYDRGLLRPGATIIEATSGNTGISFAALGRALGHPVVIFMPDWMRLVSNISPTKWNIQALEGAIWRGSSFVEMLWPCGMLIAIGLAGFYVGVVFLKRRAE